MEKKFRLEMDTVFSGNKQLDPKFESTLGVIKYLDENEICFSVIDWHGPGGSWPIIEYTDTEEKLKKLLKELYSMDEEDVEFHMSEAIEIPETVKLKFPIGKHLLPENVNDILKDVGEIEGMITRLTGKVHRNLELEVEVPNDWTTQQIFDLGCLISLCESKFNRS